MPKAQTLLSVEEYSSTVRRPDGDYVDGEALERNIAEGDHRWMQSAAAPKSR